MPSQENSTEHTKKNLYQSFSNSSKRLKRKKLSQITVYKATITVKPKSDKNTAKKENYRPISLMDIDVKLLNEILAKQIQQYTQKDHTQ